VLRSRNLAAQTKLVFHFGLAIVACILYKCLIAGTNGMRSIRSQFSGLINPDRTESTNYLLIIIEIRSVSADVPVVLLSIETGNEQLYAGLPGFCYVRLGSSKRMKFHFIFYIICTFYNILLDKKPISLRYAYFCSWLTLIHVIQLTNRIGQSVVASRCLHTADSCSRQCIRYFHRDNMFAVHRCVVTLEGAQKTHDAHSSDATTS